MVTQSLGILGGGQLAMMLAEAATRMDIRVKCTSLSREDPVTLTVAESIVEGSIHDLKDCQVVTFESEFVDAALLRSSPSRFCPSLRCLETLQDKLNQKQLLSELRISSAECKPMPAGSTLEPWLLDLSQKLPAGFVVKWAMLGYDGKGTVLVNPEMIQEGKDWLIQAKDSCQKAQRKNVRLFAEPLVDFESELAVVGCRNEKGAWALYPLVQSVQKAGVCLWVQGPAVKLGVPGTLEKEAHEILQKIGNKLDYVGCLAVEFFLTRDHKLLVNEIAPRVHNTGHYTLDASSCSQFENHVRAVIGLPLVTPKISPAFVMRNLLATESSNLRIPHAYRPPEVEDPVFVTWYGKTKLERGRKMGHMTAVVNDPKSLDALKQQLESVEKELWLDVKRKAH